MISNKLNKVYSLYESWRYKEALDLNNEILKSDPNNIYAKRYSSILANKIWISSKKEIPRVKWKRLSCPHCNSAISVTWLTQEQQKKLKSKNYSWLEIKCPYCHKNFVLQTKKANSILWIKVWDIATIWWKKYRVTWYVEYEWTWNEYYSWTLSEYWELNYLEWILVWDDKSYIYFSEWTSYYDWWEEEEFEISKKYIPRHKIVSDYERKFTIIWNSKKYFVEIDNVKVKSVYWENAKSYTVWEKVVLYDNWLFIIEKEWAWSQEEVGFYKWESITKKEAWEIFWEIDAVDYTLWMLAFFFALWYFWTIADIVPIRIIIYIISILILSIFLYFYFGNNKRFSKRTNIIMSWIIIIPILWFWIFHSFFNSILEKKEKVLLENIWISSKYELDYLYLLSDKKVTWTTRYDYWWVRTFYSAVYWLKFSVKNENDLKIIEKIRDLKNKNSLNLNEKDINEKFSWTIYKLK